MEKERITFGYLNNNAVNFKEQTKDNMLVGQARKRKNNILKNKDNPQIDETPLVTNEWVSGHTQGRQFLWYLSLNALTNDIDTANH